LAQYLDSALIALRLHFWSDSGFTARSLHGSGGGALALLIHFCLSACRAA
jgi:hypothetical protein